MNNQLEVLLLLLLLLLLLQQLLQLPQLLQRLLLLASWIILCEPKSVEGGSIYIYIYTYVYTYIHICICKQTRMCIDEWKGFSFDLGYLI